MVLFSIVNIIYSTIKMIFQKKEKPRRRRFANFKKFAFGVWGNTNKRGKGYPFPLLAIMANFVLYTIFIIYLSIEVWQFKTK